MNRKIFPIVAILIIFSRVQCDVLGLDNASTCQDICTECGGEASYVNSMCQCTVPEDLPAGQDCFVRKLRQAKFLNVDIVSCDDSSGEKRTTRCVVASKFRKNDIEQVAKYFMNDGPIVGSIFRAPPRAEKKIDEPIECNNDQVEQIVGNINMENLRKYTSVRTKPNRRPTGVRTSSSPNPKTSLPTNPNFVGSAQRTVEPTSRCKLPRRQQNLTPSLLKLLITELKRQLSSLPQTLQNMAHTPSTEENSPTFFNSVSPSMDVNDQRVECNCKELNKPPVQASVPVQGTQIIRFMGIPVITMLAPPKIVQTEKPLRVEAKIPLKADCPPVTVKTDCPPVQDVTTEPIPIATIKELEIEFPEVVTNPPSTTSEPDCKQDLVVAPDLMPKDTDEKKEIETVSNFIMEEPNYSSTFGVPSEAVNSPTITYLASMPASFLPSLIFNAPFMYKQPTNEQILTNFEPYENLNNVGQEAPTEFTIEIPYPKKICKKSPYIEYSNKFKRDVKPVSSTIKDESNDSMYMLANENFNRKTDMVSVPEIYRTTTQKPISGTSDIKIVSDETTETKGTMIKIKSSKELDEFTKKPISDKKLLASKRSINITK
ncbi:uncharacterized protein LOC111694325 [Trichogramma pretiosum]|uniref:uncharacterized protein LOC111694325 n=1 Tax=Trichogramma pretiosum TaxID=7493 RepID=UPI000C71C469|nr:uncharacterized protein LOC111694325 [Trichogramma pretiosum]